MHRPQFCHRGNRRHRPAKADRLDDILSAKTLRCATFTDVPPFASPDLKTREMPGFDVDLCNAIAKQLGVTAEVKPVSVEARVLEVKLGRVDITVANLPTPRAAPSRSSSAIPIISPRKC